MGWISDRRDPHGYPCDRASGRADADPSDQFFDFGAVAGEDVGDIFLFAGEPLVEGDLFLDGFHFPGSETHFLGFYRDAGFEDVVWECVF